MCKRKIPRLIKNTSLALHKEFRRKGQQQLLSSRRRRCFASHFLVVSSPSLSFFFFFPLLFFFLFLFIRPCISRVRRQYDVRSEIRYERNARIGSCRTNNSDNGTIGGSVHDVECEGY